MLTKLLGKNKVGLVIILDKPSVNICVFMNFSIYIFKLCSISLCLIKILACANAPVGLLVHIISKVLLGFVVTDAVSAGGGW
jgi:hypothetical protein